MLIQYKERNDIKYRVIVSLLAFVFLFNDLAFCLEPGDSPKQNTLAPQSIIATKAFQDDAASLYLKDLIGKFLRDISRLLASGMTEEGIPDHFRRFKESVLKSAFRQNLGKFKCEDMRMEGRSVCLPYAHKDDGSIANLRYYLKKGPPEELVVEGLPKPSPDIADGGPEASSSSAEGKATMSISSAQQELRNLICGSGRRQSSVTDRRIEMLPRLVAKLAVKLDRRPNIMEVAEAMHAREKTGKVRSCYDWISRNIPDPEKFGMQKFAATGQELKGHFSFAGFDLVPPEELSGKIKVKPASSVRSEAKKLSLQAAANPAIEIDFIDNPENIEIRFRNKVSTLAKPVGKNKLHISEASAFIAFRDTILGIPEEFGLARKEALIKWLEKEGVNFKLSSENTRGKSVTINPYILLLPSYYDRHPHRIVIYRDTHHHSRYIGLVDSENPGNYIVLEKRDGELYSAESGEKVAADYSRKFGGFYPCSLSKTSDFTKFDEALGKEKIFLVNDLSSLQVAGLAQTRFAFRALVPLGITGFETARTNIARNDRERYPLIITRSGDGGQITIAAHERGDKEFTISCLHSYNGKTIVLDGTNKEDPYFNLNVLLRLVELGKFSGILYADPVMAQTFNSNLSPTANGRFNPVLAYKVVEDKDTIRLQPGGLVDPQDLDKVDIRTGTTIMPSEAMPEKPSPDIADNGTIPPSLKEICGNDLAGAIEKLRERQYKLKLSIVVPMYNEERRLENEHFVREKIGELERLSRLFANLIEWELIFVDDGSTDGTVRAVENAIKSENASLSFPGKAQVLRVAYESGEEKRRMRSKKGYAVRVGADYALSNTRKHKSADIVMYTDADMSANLKEAWPFICRIINNENVVAIGSRSPMDGGDRSNRDILKYLIGPAYPFIVGRILPPLAGLNDTQCGFKLYPSRVLRPVLDILRNDEEADNYLSFDTEWLLLAKLLGFNIEARGIPWLDSPRFSKTSYFKDFIPMVRGVWHQRRWLAMADQLREFTERSKPSPDIADSGPAVFPHAMTIAKQGKLSADNLFEIREALKRLKPEDWNYRTAMIRAENGQTLAVKFRKRGEGLSTLEEEARTMRDLKDRGMSISGILQMPDGGYIFNCNDAPANAPYDVDASYRAIVYTARPENFIYPEDIHNLDDMRTCALHSISQFAGMLNIGFVHTSLSPLSHTKGALSPWRWDHKPLGGVEDMEEETVKSNIRLAGLADFAHARRITPGESLYSDVMQGICEWAMVITYHSLKNGITEKETASILKDGFNEFLKTAGVSGGITLSEPDQVEKFISLFHKEFKNQDIPFQNTTEAPVFDKLVSLVAGVADKVYSSNNSGITTFKRLLVINSASEITGATFSKKRQRIIDEITAKIEYEIKNNGGQHIIEILRKTRAGMGTDAKREVNRLIEKVRRNRKFNYKDLAYQAIVSVVRAWPKRQWHAHIGGSIHEGFIWNEMVLYNKNLLENAIEKSDLSAGKKKAAQTINKSLQKHIKAGRLWQDLPAGVKYDFSTLFTRLGLSRHIGFYDKESWKRAVTHVALEHFSDGVVDLHLLININRKFFSSTEESIKYTISALEEAERLARAKPGVNFSAKLVVSFARQANGPKDVEVALDKIIKLREADEGIRNHVAGIDISGAEAIIDHKYNTHYRKTSDYKGVIEKARKSGLAAMSHLGDWGNTYEATLAPNRVKEPDNKMELADIGDREQLASLFLDFVQDGVQNSGRLDAVLHGTVLAPKGSVITKGPRKGRSFAGEPITDSDSLKRIEDLLGYLRANNIEIMACPSVNVRTQKIKRYKKHPLHQWLEKGNRISINVDDFYWTTNSTLSDDIVKMMLTAPLGKDIKRLTPKLAREISAVQAVEAEQQKPSPDISDNGPTVPTGAAAALQKTYQKAMQESREFVREFNSILRSSNFNVTCEGHAYETRRRLSKDYGISSNVYFWTEGGEAHFWVVTRNGDILDPFPMDGAEPVVILKGSKAGGVYEKGCLLGEGASSTRYMEKWDELVSQIIINNRSAIFATAAAEKPSPDIADGGPGDKLGDFLRRNTFAHSMADDGSIYEQTPYNILLSIFNTIQKRFGSLNAKSFLDIGAGDLRASLVAAVLYKMRVKAAEKSQSVSKGTSAVCAAAVKEGVIAPDDIDLSTNTDATGFSWNNIDLAYFFYTEPSDAGALKKLRDDLQMRVNQMGPGGVFAVLFTRAHLSFMKHVFSDIALLSQPIPIEAPGAYKGLYYLALYGPKGSHAAVPIAAKPANKIPSGLESIRIVEWKSDEEIGRINGLFRSPGSAATGESPLDLDNKEIELMIRMHKVLRVDPQLSSNVFLRNNWKGAAVMITGPGKTGIDLYRFIESFEGVREIHVVDACIDEYDLKFIDINIARRQKDTPGNFPKIFWYRTTAVNLPPGLTNKIDLAVDCHVFDSTYFDSRQKEKAAEEVARVLAPNGIHISMGLKDEVLECKPPIVTIPIGSAGVVQMKVDEIIKPSPDTVETIRSREFMRFKGILEDSIKLIRADVAEKRTEDLRRHGELLIQAVDKYRYSFKEGTIERTFLEEVLQDVFFNSVTVIWLGIELKNLDEVTEALKTIEGNIEQLGILNAAGRLIDAEKACVSTSHYDASLVLKGPNAALSSTVSAADKPSPDIADGVPAGPPAVAKQPNAKPCDIKAGCFGCMNFIPDMMKTITLSGLTKAPFTVDEFAAALYDVRGVQTQPKKDFVEARREILARSLEHLANAGKLLRHADANGCKYSVSISTQQQKPSPDIADNGGTARLKKPREKYFVKGVHYYNKGDYVAALRVLKNSLRYDKDNVSTLVYICYTLLKLERYEEVFKYAARCFIAIDREKQTGIVYDAHSRGKVLCAISHAYTGERKFRGAVEASLEALKLDQREPHYRRHLARAYLEWGLALGAPRAAAKMLAKAILHADMAIADVASGHSFEDREKIIDECIGMKKIANKRLGELRHNIRKLIAPPAGSEKPSPDVADNGPVKSPDAVSGRIIPITGASGTTMKTGKKKNLLINKINNIYRTVLNVSSFREFSKQMEVDVRKTGPSWSWTGPLNLAMYLEMRRYDDLLPGEIGSSCFGGVKVLTSFVRLYATGKITAGEVAALLSHEIAHMEAGDPIKLCGRKLTCQEEIDRWVEGAVLLEKAGFSYQNIIRLQEKVQGGIMEKVWNPEWDETSIESVPRVSQIINAVEAAARLYNWPVDGRMKRSTSAVRRPKPSPDIADSALAAPITANTDIDLERERKVAVDFRNNLIALAYAAKEKGETIILGLDESWIPKGAGATPLITAIKEFTEDLKRRGLDNVIFRRGRGDEVALAIQEAQKASNAKFSNIIVIGKNDILESSEFKKLKGVSEEDAAMLIGVNASNLQYTSGMRILEMYFMAMALNEGKDPSQLDQTFITINPAAGKRAFIFTPIKPHDLSEFRRVYELQIKQLDINA